MLAPMRMLVVVLAAAIVLVGAESAQACTCAYVRPAVQLKRSDAALIARHLDVRPIEGSAEVEFVYRVGRVYKGEGLRRGRRIRVRTYSSDSICGLTPTPGGLTGLFLARRDDGWTSGSCGQVSAKQMRRLGDKGTPAAAGGCDGSAAAA
jgi:hypothetical protein